MFERLEQRARGAARRGVSGLLGAIFVAVGLGFLTHAAWIALAEARGALFAAQVLGGVYVFLGGVLLVAAARGSGAAQPASRPVARPATATMLVEAFLVGLAAAKAARRGARDANRT